MNRDREALLRKVRAMLAKSAGTDNPEEAMAFLEKAQAWLVEHNISEAELTDDGMQHDYIILDAPVAPDWEQRVNQAVARLYFCRYFVVTLSPGGKPRQVHSFCGEEHNVRVAHAMAEYIISTLKRLLADHTQQRREKGLLYEPSFLHQASVTVAYRIMQRILASIKGSAATEGTTLPALADAYNRSQAIDEWLQNRFGEPGSHKPPSLERFDPEGLEDGDTAGAAVGLDTQLTGAGKDLLK